MNDQIRTKRGMTLLRFLINHYPLWLNKEIASQMPDYIKTDYFDKFKWLLVTAQSKTGYEISNSLKKIKNILLEKFDCLSFDAIAETGDSQLIFIKAWGNIDELTLSLCESDKNDISTSNNIKLFNEKNINVIKKLYEYISFIAQYYYLQKKYRDKIWLANIYFLNDEINPTKQDEFQGAVKLINNLIGLDEKCLDNYFINIFIDTFEIDNLVKQMILEQLDRLSQKIEKKVFLDEGRKYDEWRGADVIISNTLSKEIDNWLSTQPFHVFPYYYCGFPHPKRRAIITEYSKELSWLFCQLRDIFINFLDFYMKYNFYGQLAQSAQNYIQSVKTPECNVLLNVVLNEAIKFVKKSNWKITIE